MNETDSQLTQVLLQVVITVVVPVLAAFAAAWIRMQTQSIQLKMNTEQRMFTEALIRSAVAAAEQYDLAGLVKRSGQEKKAWVVAQVQQTLDSAGIHWDAQQLADLVEASILTGAKAPWPQLPPAELVE
jgi:ribosome-binding ATPase YchF (GTP1/OBG family)